ncbi:cyclic pyranopterin monophosphate synthase MoaC [Aureibacillus halotolerans]|uniref:Cyclic pyranopterin monophosphate synthase n=1 Tax=Aureibacillus halotolerans TaxID=1508390 RepID=A0A4R6U9A1_9BACI|nr:cyclic pyranopterin monophosphate synthase MoaC [Aureibacillus halotolerans]TDQ43021.1 cyclic pyranopterin monophosphate synthase subunit MoaC [Aureibacillus halotolerans]
MKEFTHLNEQGRARMVDVSAKPETVRTAKARTSIFVNQDIYIQIKEQTTKKGDVLAVAQVAGIMAVKQTSAIIPMCHPIPVLGIDISFEWQIDETNQIYELVIDVEAKTKGSTGIEMEVLTGASVTALTVYDMCKALDKGMVIGQTMLLTKTGGQNGRFQRDDA